MRIRHGRMAKAPRRGIGGTGEMYKSVIVARVAARTGLNKFTAEDAVDIVFEAIAEGLPQESSPGKKPSRWMGQLRIGKRDS